MNSVWRVILSFGLWYRRWADNHGVGHFRRAGFSEQNIHLRGGPDGVRNVRFRLDISGQWP